MTIIRSEKPQRNRNLLDKPSSKIFGAPNPSNPLVTVLFAGGFRSPELTLTNSPLPFPNSPHLLSSPFVCLLILTHLLNKPTLELFPLSQLLQTFLLQTFQFPSLPKRTSVNFHGPLADPPISPFFFRSF